MENHTVVQLKAVAKERRIRGYYKLRKAELIHALEARRLVEQKSNICDEPIPNDPILMSERKIFMNKNGESYRSAIEIFAKERRIRGYYKLRKAELIHAFKARRLVEQEVTSVMSRFQTIPL